VTANGGRQRPPQYRHTYMDVTFLLSRNTIGAQSKELSKKEVVFADRKSKYNVHMEQLF
jgi:hypothetical protein